MRSRAELERVVSQRAAERCEYCGMHQNLQGTRFHLEHVIPISRGGATASDNLAWGCPGCNLRKSDRVEAIDLMTSNSVALYSPRLHRWSDHFVWDDYQIVGQTAIGRATVAVLDMNHAARRMRIRQAEQTFGLFPPER